MINGTALDDAIFGSLNGEEIRAGAGDDLIDGGDGSDLVYGEDGDDTIIGSIGTGEDTYDGGAGRDLLTYYDALAGVKVDLSLLNDHARSMSGDLAGSPLDLAGIGVDQIVGIEDIEGTAFGDMLTGNAANNALYGREGNDTLNGGLGNDTLSGGLGDDVMNGGAGIDTADYSDATKSVYVSLAVTGLQSTGQGRDTLAGFENLVGSSYSDVLSGSAGHNQLFGGAGADRLIGDAGNDTLDGGSGADRLTGGIGSDTYIVDSAADLIFENAGEGTDTVIIRTQMSYTLAANLENATLEAPGLILEDEYDDDDLSLSDYVALTGNGLANTLKTGSGMNLLDGGAGADRMYGGTGRDVYIVDNVGDVVVEYSDTYDEGDAILEVWDKVISSVSYTISNVYVEELVLTGTANINGTGNATDNWVIGNAGSNVLKGMGGYDYLEGGDGNDTLDGGTGIDYMDGGFGNDTYIVDDINDQVYDYGGIDTVRSSVSFFAYAGMENIILTGTANINAGTSGNAASITGNSGANQLNGSGYDDKLSGGAGSDLIYGNAGVDAINGGLGVDILYGGSGADNFYFDDGEFGGTAAGACDVIKDFSQAQGDRIRLNAVDADSSLAGDQAFTFIGTDAFTGVAGQLRYEVSPDGYALVTGDVDGDGLADFALQVNNVVSLTGSDFIF